MAGGMDVGRTDWFGEWEWKQSFESQMANPSSFVKSEEETRGQIQGKKWLFHS